MSAPAPAPKPAPKGGPRFEVNEQLEAAGTMFRAHLLKCLPLAMVAVLASSAADLYWRMRGHTLSVSVSEAGKIKLPDDPLFWIIDVAGTFLSILLMSSVVLRLHALRSGRLPSIGENLRAAAARWLPAMAATILGMIAVAIGLLALLVPGIYLAVCLVVLLPVVLFEPVEPMAAVVRAFQLVRPVWVKVFACTLISALIGLICLLALTGVMGLLFGAVLNNHLAEAVLQAVFLAGFAAFYVFIAALSLALYTAASSSA
jgi:hypothetical protein